MILVEMENMVGKDVELMIDGHFFNGRVTAADAATNTITLQEEDGSSYLVDVEAISMVKV